jgi:magnesium chelatase family protein
MATVLKSFAISGIDGYVVNIEIDTIYGKPSVSIVGMGDTAIKEARERLFNEVIENIRAFYNGKVRNRVDK